MLKTILKKQKVGELTLPDFNTYYKTTVQCGIGKGTDISQWNRTGNPEANPYTQLVNVMD